MSVKRQCELLEVPRSSYYDRIGGRVDLRTSKQAQDELLMREMDRIYMEEPTYGSRRLLDELKLMGYEVGRDRVRRLMREMGIEPIYPKPRLSQPGKGHKIYPYLLRNLDIVDPGHVWCTDITYIPLLGSHVYLSVVMDWASRYVISWRLSNSLDESFCVECLAEALEKEPPPKICNSDQGSQFTGTAFTDKLKDAGVLISMDGRGRALDNRMVERLWRTVKYDDIYIRAYETMGQLHEGLNRFFQKYNNRSHQGLDRTSPLEAYRRYTRKKAA